MKAWLIGLLMICTSSFCIAEEESREDSSESFFVEAGGVLFVSGMMTLSPEMLGRAMTVLSPLAAADEKTGEISLIRLAGVVGVSQYNAQELSKEKYSRREVFTRNLAAWGSFYIVDKTSKWLFNKLGSPKELSIQPTKKQGLALAYSKQF